MTSRFDTSWSDTRVLLERELKFLGAEHAVLELALDESDIRIDGWPRASARPKQPGVVLSFDSHHGPLRYGTDGFPAWQDNARAIALSLEALRKVDRYGIGKRGEQYVGWRQLEAGTSDEAKRGAEIIEKHGSLRSALLATHPDRGGDPNDFRAVQAAKEQR